MLELDYLSKDFIFKRNEHLFNKEWTIIQLHWSKVTVKTIRMLQKFCSFELYIQIILKKCMMVSTNVLGKTVFNIDNKYCSLSIKLAY